MGGELSDPKSSNPEPSAPASPGAADLVCPQCQTAMPASAAFCPGCGHAMKQVPHNDRVLAAVAYMTMAPAVVLLLLPAYRHNGFVRFHAWQSTLLWGSYGMLTIVAVLVSNIAAAIGLLLIGILASLAMFFLWMVLSLKAWQGELFELPLFGTLADRLR
jgi:uncharacterized membrane protein